MGSLPGQSGSAAWDDSNNVRMVVSNGDNWPIVDLIGDTNLSVINYYKYNDLISIIQAQKNPTPQLMAFGFKFGSGINGGNTICNNNQRLELKQGAITGASFSVYNNSPQPWSGVLNYEIKVLTGEDWIFGYERKIYRGSTTISTPIHQGNAARVNIDAIAIPSLPSGEDWFATVKLLNPEATTLGDRDLYLQPNLYCAFKVLQNPNAQALLRTTEMSYATGLEGDFGTVTSDPINLSCSGEGTSNATCYLSAPVGQTITVRVTPISGYKIKFWNINQTRQCWGANECTIPLDGDKEVTLLFSKAIPTYVDVSKGKYPSAVKIEMSGPNTYYTLIRCDEDGESNCKTLIPIGADYYFNTFSDTSIEYRKIYKYKAQSCRKDRICNIFGCQIYVVCADWSEFDKGWSDTPLSRVFVSTVGSGEVLGYQGLPIHCGNTCVASLEVNPDIDPSLAPQVTLIAIPHPTAQFIRWLGCPYPQGTGCSYPLIHNDFKITAEFSPRNPNKFLLGILMAGGSGTVMTTDGRIACEPTQQNCIGVFEKGELVQLQVTAPTGSVLSGWSPGECASFTMPAKDINCIAQFGPLHDLRDCTKTQLPKQVLN